MEGIAAMNKPWIGAYDLAVPANLVYPDHCIQDFLIQQSIFSPYRAALVHDGVSITYFDLAVKAKAFAWNLMRMGLQTGDRVAICLSNTPEFVIAYYGTLMAGGVVAAMNPTYPVPELVFQVRIAKPIVLVGSFSRIADFVSVCCEHQIKNLVLTSEYSIHDDPNLEMFSFQDLVRPIEKTDFLPNLTNDAAAVLQFSGGTTGVPKAALALHRSVVANVIQFKTWLTTLKEGQEVFLTAIPLYHVYGMVIGLNVGIALGATIVLVSNPRDLDGMLKTAQQYQTTFFPGVPSIYQAINHYAPALNGEIDLRSIKACISGSAPLLEEVRVTFERLTGGKLVEGYGLSEAPTATHCNPIQGENRSGSIGLPLPDVDCRIVDLKDPQKDAGVGDEGELWIRGPQLMKEYFEMPEETAAALKDGWLRTGDIARVDAEGYFYIVGRLKELIKVNGLQVWPTEVEQVLTTFPEVVEAAAAGVPDSESGEAVKAWIVVGDATRFDIQALEEHCRKNLASYKIPKEFSLVGSLPKTPVGKILRRKLVEAEASITNNSGA